MLYSDTCVEQMYLFFFLLITRFIFNFLSLAAKTRWLHNSCSPCYILGFTHIRDCTNMLNSVFVLIAYICTLLLFVIQHHCSRWQQRSVLIAYLFPTLPWLNDELLWSDLMTWLLLHSTMYPSWSWCAGNPPLKMWLRFRVQRPITLYPSNSLNCSVKYSFCDRALQVSW